MECALIQHIPSLNILYFFHRFHSDMVKYLRLFQLYISLQGCLLIFLLALVNLEASGQTSRLNHPALDAKDHRRSEHFSSSRSDINGSMFHYNQTIQSVQDSLREAVNKRNTSQSDTLQGNYRFPQWYPLGPSVNKAPVLSQLGLVSAMWVDTVDYLTMYAGSNTGGIFATNDGGENWRSISDNYITTGVLAIEVDPEDKQHIYIGTGHWGFNRAWGNGVMESKDGGNSWTSTSLNAGIMSRGFIVQDIKLHSKHNDTLYAVMNADYNGGTNIYRSTNKAVNWEPVYNRPGEELFDIVLTPGKPDNIFAVGSLLLRSRDAGSTWQDLTYRLDTEINHRISRLALAVSDTVPGLILVYTESYDTLNPGSKNYQLFRSINDGRTYEKVAVDLTPFSGYWKLELQISPADPMEFYLGGIWFFKYRLDGDTARYLNFNNHKYHRDVRELLVYRHADGDRVIMGNDGGVTVSFDGAITWQDRTRNGMQSTQLHNISIANNSNMVYGGPQDGNLCFYNYDTGEWTRETHIGDAYDGMVDYNNPKNVYLVTYPPKLNRKNIFLLKSTNAGLNFSYRGVPDTTEQGKNSIPVAMHPQDPNIMYAGLKNLWKSTDGAETWEKVSSFNPLNSHKIQSIEISESHPDVICISFENPAWGNIALEKLMITTDGGSKWNDITPRGSLSLQWVSAYDILINPKKPANIYLALDRNWNDNRVYVTNDGGRTWNNFSQGLPNIPINAIRYFKGAEYDILFAATDAGVFYRDELMSKWELFGEGLPLTVISDIEINYTKKKLVAATFGRGLWEADICLPLIETAFTISDTLTWPKGRNILSDLVLLPGSKLTINDRVEVGDGRTIKVLPGAHLSIEKGTLTNNCISLWQGIKVYGSSDYNSNLPQGKVTMQYGAVIENAFTGIEMVAIDENGNENSAKGGGVIECNKAIFKNNLRALDIKPTTGTNPSKFILTEFILDHQPWPGEQMEEFVRIRSSSGLEFYSCIFRNDVPQNKLSIAERGTGINSYNSSIRVGKIESDSVPLGTSLKPLFFQLKTGIYVTASLPGYTFFADNLTFKNNFTGFYIAGFSSFETTSCSFELNSLNIIDSTNKEVTGIYIDNCMRFNLLNNTFKGPGLLGSSNQLTGVVINNCLDNNNLIANNKFSFLNYSILAQNRNRNSKGDEGLRFYYNNFLKNGFDICVTRDSLVSLAGVATYQGAHGMPPIEPAGNYFSHSKAYRTSDFHNDGEPIIYSHYNNSTILSRQMPRLFANLWLINSAFPLPSDSTYLPTYLHFDPVSVEGNGPLWDEHDLNAQNLFNLTKDGGMTNDILHDINMLTPETAADLYKRLRKLDSKLSTDVLRELISNNYFHNSLLIDILINNPIIFRDRNTLGLIIERKPPLQPYMLNQLTNRYLNYSQLELLESRRDNIRAIRDALLTCEINKHWFPEPPVESSALYARIMSTNNIQSNFITASAYYQRGNHLLSEEILTNASHTYPDKNDAIESMDRLFKLHSTLNEADTLTQQQLTEIADLLTEEYTFIYAQNILKRYGQSEYSEPYILPGEPRTLLSIEIPPFVIEGNSFKIYPQPASNYIIFDYQYADGFTGGHLELRNTTGQVVSQTLIQSNYGQEYVDISSLLPGLYVARLISGNTVIDRQKLLIIR